MFMPNAPVGQPVPGFSEKDLVKRSASSVPAPARRLTEVAKLIDISKCIGCKACQSACIEWNDTHPEMETFQGTYMNPHDLTPNMFTLMRFNEWTNPETEKLEWLIRKDGCMHCSDPGCLKACPAPGAIVQYSNGILGIGPPNGNGCGYCVKGCPFNIPRISQTDHKAYKCTLCSDRVAVGQGPACAKACPTHAISWGSKEEMKIEAATRVKDLNARGYKNAGLYDPPGVGGTHVMYVLHHADKPEIYANLPNNPRISPLVNFWKGGFKVVGLASLAFAAIGGFLHYITAGPDEVPKSEEKEAAHEAEGHIT